MLKAENEKQSYKVVQTIMGIKHLKYANVLPKGSLFDEWDWK